jgi:acetoin utilization protein AcuB
VIDKGKLTGILTDRDLHRHLDQVTRTKGRSCHGRSAPFGTPSIPVEQAAHLLEVNKISSLPVVEHGKLVGIITTTDMLRALQAILGSGADGSVRIDLEMRRGKT